MVLQWVAYDHCPWLPFTGMRSSSPSPCLQNSSTIFRSMLHRAHGESRTGSDLHDALVRLRVAPRQDQGHGFGPMAVHTG